MFAYITELLKTIKQDMVKVNWWWGVCSGAQSNVVP